MHRPDGAVPGLKLTAGDWQAGVLPAGGVLTSLSCGGVEVLRTMPEGSTDPLESACFPLIPYANRIRGAGFEWQRTPVQLPHNFAPETSSLHGLGWENDWSVESHRTFKCALEHRHAGLGPAPWDQEIGTWPWAYHADERVRLGPKGCAISLSLTNQSNLPMPAGLGLHPYFRRRPETQIRFNSNGILDVDDALIPNGKILPSNHFANWADADILPAQTVDHCFIGWDGIVQIKDDLGTITMTARGAPFLHVYAPEDGSALCLEPVSHIPDAINQDPAGITALPPGCSATMQMWIAAE